MVLRIIELCEDYEKFDRVGRKTYRRKKEKPVGNLNTVGHRDKICFGQGNLFISIAVAL